MINTVLFYHTAAQNPDLNRSYNFVDIIKFICATLVIAIHVPPFSGVHFILRFAAVNFVARIAVPYFFVSSAYFVFKKAYDPSTGDLNSAVIFKYIKKILRLYIIWSVIYAPVTYYHILETSPNVTILQFLKYYTMRFICSASYGHLWYLNSIIFAHIFLLLMLSMKIKTAAIAVFSLLMYCLGVCAQSWFGLIEPLRQFPQLWSFLLQIKKIFLTTRNGLFEGLIFTIMGMFFATHDVKINFKTAFLCFVGSFILLAAEIYMLTKLEWIREYDMYFGLLPTVFFMFYISLTIELPSAGIYKKLRTYSALIYFSHMLFVEILIIVPTLGNMPGGAPAQYMFTFLTSLIFSMLFVKLSEKFKFLVYLYK